MKTFNKIIKNSLNKRIVKDCLLFTNNKTVYESISKSFIIKIKGVKEDKHVTNKINNIYNFNKQSFSDKESTSTQSSKYINNTEIKRSIKENDTMNLKSNNDYLSNDNDSSETSKPHISELMHVTDSVVKVRGKIINIDY